MQLERDSTLILVYNWFANKKGIVEESLVVKALGARFEFGPSRLQQVHQQVTLGISLLLFVRL